MCRACISFGLSSFFVVRRGRVCLVRGRAPVSGWLCSLSLSTSWTCSLPSSSFSSIDTNYLVDFRALDQHDPRPLVRKDNFQPALVGGAFSSAMSFSLCAQQTILNYFFNLAIHLWPSEPLFNSKQGFWTTQDQSRQTQPKKADLRGIFNWIYNWNYNCFPHCFEHYIALYKSCDFVGENPVIQDYHLFLI